MLALYHFGPVANSLTPLLCLLEKGLEFDNRYLNSRLWEHHDPEFQKISPEGMVPVLLHDGNVVTESTVINEYIDTVFPDVPLRPADPYLQAQMRVWTKYVDEYFCPALTTLGAHGATPFASKIDRGEMAARLARMPNEEVRRKWETVSRTGYSEEQLADARRKLGIVAERMEKGLSGSCDWLVGDHYSLADIKWYSMTPGLERMVPDVCNDQKTPNIIAWLSRMRERPAVRALASYQAVR